MCNAQSDRTAPVWRCGSLLLALLCVACDASDDPGAVTVSRRDASDDTAVEMSDDEEVPDDAPDPEAEACVDPLAQPATDYALSEDVVYYEIRGETALELRAEMDAKGPMGYDALTDWDVAWTWTSANCTMATYSVTLTIVYQFPVWDPLPGTDPALIERWNAYMDSLWCHEFGHATFAVAASQQSVRGFEAIGEQTSCAGVFEAGEAVFDPILARAKRDNAHYDEATDHGVTMGARFP